VSTFPGSPRILKGGIVVLKASVEERKIDFRLVGDEGPVKPLPPRGKPAKRTKKPY